MSDPEDVKFYEAAIENNNPITYLITGNIKHFPKEPFMKTPIDFIKMLDIEA